MEKPKIFQSIGSSNYLGLCLPPGWIADLQVPNDLEALLSNLSEFTKVPCVRIPAWWLHNEVSK